MLPSPPSPPPPPLAPPPLLSADILTLLVGRVASAALASALLLGLALRHYAHLFSEPTLATLLLALYVTLLVAVAVPILRWILLLLLELDDASMTRAFALIVVPVMAATSVWEFTMIGSWILYRRELVAASGGSEAPRREERRADTRSTSQQFTPMRCCYGGSAPSAQADAGTGTAPVSPGRPVLGPVVRRVSVLSAGEASVSPRLLQEVRI